jgi:hypothetical protein
MIKILVPVIKVETERLGSVYTCITFPGYLYVTSY